MKKSKFISLVEIQELWNMGYVIHANYLGPIEGTEFWFMKIGDWDHSKYGGKSERSAYNRCKRYAAEQKMHPTNGGLSASDSLSTPPPLAGNLSR